MLASLTTVSLFSLLVLTTNTVSAQNTTTTSYGGVASPLAPVIASSETSLALASTSDAASTTTDVSATAYSDTVPSSSSVTSATSVYQSPVVESSQTSLPTDTTSPATSPAGYTSTDATATTTPVTEASSYAASSTTTPAQTPGVPQALSSETSLATPTTPIDSSSASSPEATTDATTALFTYAPETTTAASSDLLAGYIGSIAQSEASSSAGASATTTDAVASGSTVAFAYSPSTASDETGAEQTATTAESLVAYSSAVPTAVSVGSSEVSIAPVPQTYAAGESGSSSVPAAYVIGSQTASVGQTITVDNTPIVVQTSAGQTELYLGTATTPATLSFAANTGSTLVAASTITGAPTTHTIGVASVSQDSAGNYIIGSETLAVGSSITQGSGSAAAVIVASSVNGSIAVIVHGATTTATTTLPAITKAPHTSSSARPTELESSAVVVNGHTYYLGPASLAAQGGATAVSSGFATTGVPQPSFSGSPIPNLQNSAASRSGLGMLSASIAACAIGMVILL